MVNHHRPHLIPNKKMMDGKASTQNQDELEEMRKVFAIFGF